MVMRNTLMLVSSFLAIGLGAPVVAQPAPTQSAPQTVTDAASIPDIVVTAQKRSERLQDVPIAIAAISGEALGKGQTTTIADVARGVPGLQFNAVFQSSNPTIFLRGIGVNDYNPASSGAVGVSIDEVFLNSGVGQIFNVYDVDRIEVLKGPQGTLFGRNTTGGIINVYTRRPTFDLSADAAVTYGSFNQLFADAAIGGPIISDVLAARASFTYHRRDGWARNLLDGQRVNDIDSLGGRFQLLFKPTPTFTISLKLEGGRSDSSAIRGKSAGVFNVAASRPCTGDEILELTRCANPISGFVDSADLSTYRTNVTDNYELLRTHAARLGLEWNAGSVSVTSISSYNYNRRALSQDQDMSPARILESPLWTDRSRQFSQELRVSSTGTGNFRWVAGAFYLNENLKSYTDFELLGGFAPSSAPFFDPVNSIITIGRRYTQKTDSTALFAQADYTLAPGLTLTTGARFTWDRKKLDFITVAGPVNNPGRLLATPIIGLLDANIASLAIDGSILKNDSFDKPTWRLALSYKPSDAALIYASYTRGFRSGGWNSGALFSSQEFTFVRSEKNDAFEMGFKSDLLNRRLRLNGAAFYYDYKDMQVFTLQPGTPVPFQRLQNADSRIYGAELELTARPFNRVVLQAGAAYLNAKYTRLIDPTFGDLRGRNLEKSPTWQLSGSIAYEPKLSDRLTGSIRADVAYQSRIFLSPNNAAPLTRAPNAVVNAELGLRDEQTGLSATAFVKNVFEERFVQDAFDVSSFGSYALFFNEPRTAGITVAYKY